MTPSRPTHKSTVRHRQIGRKVLQADRLSRALVDNKNKKPTFVDRFSSVQRKTVIIVGLVIIGVGVLGFGGASMYFGQVAVSQKAAAVKQQAKSEKKSVEADACRRAKAAQKADLIGKVTYDELYDGDECDK